MTLRPDMNCHWEHTCWRCARRLHSLAIGDRKPPARLVFNAPAGDAIVVSLVDMGGRLRMIVQDIECVDPLAYEPPFTMPNLPVARVMWKPLPDLKTGAQAWILAGGAHNSVLSYALTAEHMRDWAEIMDIEFVHIHRGTDPALLKQELMLADLIWTLRR